MDTLMMLDHIPYFENWLCDNKTLACQIGCGTQSMVQCRHCGFIFNCAFEPENVVYGSGYHIERGVSKYYRQHLKNVAEQINSAFPIAGKTVLEAGRGTGEFLRIMAGCGPRMCIGVDPSAEDELEGCIVRRTLFDEDYLQQYQEQIDLFINRHMIEHIENPLEMLRLFARALPENGILYLETPRLDWILEHEVFYDFSYEHCSYFTDEFMERLLTAAGFSVFAQNTSFDGQYFSILAKRNCRMAPIQPASSDALKQVTKKFRMTKERYRAAKKFFSQYPSEAGTVYKGVYLWGAGGKGTMCCNLLGGRCILGCIDKNPFKQGKYIPGTGHPVIAPKEITYEKVNCVLVENDVYFDEIAEELQEIDPRIQVHSLNALLEITFS